MKLKEIKNTYAKDITRLNDKEVYSLVKKGLETIATSYGVYGMNGWLGKDKNGNLYKITKRTGNLFIVA